MKIKYRGSVIEVEKEKVQDIRPMHACGVFPEEIIILYYKISDGKKEIFSGCYDMRLSVRFYVEELKRMVDFYKETQKEVEKHFGLNSKLKLKV